MGRLLNGKKKKGAPKRKPPEEYPVENACKEINLQKYDLDFSKPPFSYTGGEDIKIEKAPVVIDEPGVIKEEEPLWLKEAVQIAKYRFQTTHDEQPPGKCRDLWRDGDW